MGNAFSAAARKQEEEIKLAPLSQVAATQAKPAPMPMPKPRIDLDGT